eukprot:2551829-Rhodomonas_salina.2
MAPVCSISSLRYSSTGHGVWHRARGIRDTAYSSIRYGSTGHGVPGSGLLGLLCVLSSQLWYQETLAQYRIRHSSIRSLSTAYGIAKAGTRLDHLSTAHGIAPYAILAISVPHTA